MSVRSSGKAQGGPFFPWSELAGTRREGQIRKALPTLFSFLMGKGKAAITIYYLDNASC